MNLTRRQFELAAITAGLAPATALAQPRAAGREVAWLKEVQTAPARLPSDAPQLASLVVNQGKRIETLEDWKKRREELRRQWWDLLGCWSKPKRPPDYEIIESSNFGGIMRRLITYESEAGFATEAYVLMPARVEWRVPGVVVLHSTVDYTIRQGAGLEGPPEAAWGLKLAQRGFAVICPRCFLWNREVPPKYEQRVATMKHRHPDARGIAKMLFDAERALDLLTSFPEVNPERLGAAGHSLGAKEALYLAAFDDRIKAAVSSEGGIGTTFSNWEAPWYLGTKPFPREHHELLALIAPRAFLLIGGESADGARSWPFIERAREVYRLHPQPSHIGLYNHRQGHTIPPMAEERVYQWLEAYL